MFYYYSNYHLIDSKIYSFIRKYFSLRIIFLSDFLMFIIYGGASLTKLIQKCAWERSKQPGELLNEA